eukprot:CAMPEP_0113584374 /NCGR_PEP_ID=MMETSP0015_2-20120614/33067_1 /TAXON_ID=2838 /ORGANISM="Odontella" /LENGTH=41 /DNA_ID=CAMNT_0000489415 /DNA_START=46 /DNA_END=167 /DNA_ORIENTATION=+ /assembly_acc=CAM_ASM_000160
MQSSDRAFSTFPQRRKIKVQGSTSPTTSSEPTIDEERLHDP